MQLKKLFDHFNSDSVNNQSKLQSQLTTIQNQIKQLKIRFGLNQIDKETYEITLEHLSDQVLEINKELNSGNGKISNLEKMISQSLQKFTKLTTVWASSDIEGKRILHKSLFPDRIFYNSQNHQYLTRKMNRYVELVSSISNSCKENKKGSSQNFLENSHSVARSGVEPETFGL